MDSLALEYGVGLLASASNTLATPLGIGLVGILDSGSITNKKAFLNYVTTIMLSNSRSNDVNGTGVSDEYT